MVRPIKSTGAAHGDRLRLTRRSVVGLICLAPFAGLPAHAAERVSFSDLWAPGADFSERAKELAGTTVEIQGYMAPPLKPEIDFFVLTSLPTAVCPFCDSAAAWPDDILLILLDRPVRALAYDQLIRVRGTLDIGTQTDASTGFVSRVRLRDSRYSKI